MIYLIDLTMNTKNKDLIGSIQRNFR